MPTKYANNDNEALLLKSLRSIGLRPKTQYQFCRSRKWRFDLCFVKEKLAIEIEGRDHLRMKQYVRDLDKFNHALAMGYRVLRYTVNGLRTKKRLPLIIEQIREVYYAAKPGITHVLSGDD